VFGVDEEPAFGVDEEPAFGVDEEPVDEEGVELEEPVAPVVELELSVEDPTLPVLDEPVLALPPTWRLSTTRRLPANDCAIRFASSRSFADGAEPFSSIVSLVTLTEMLLLVSVGSLRKAVWMSLRT
jgi:hypothetical protein